MRDLEAIRKKAEDQGGVGHRGMGWLHTQAVEALRQRHVDGSPCDWCGRPMYRDRTLNWDYDPQSKRRNGNGTLQGDHIVSRKKLMDAGLPIPIPDRLLHGVCNLQRGDGRNDHIAWINRQSTRQL